ncbi:hypothetical protein Lal_00045939 [Lupinus albus]|nr:hypothetical protein Lal_00045939 [Lupinus albus]
MIIIINIVSDFSDEEDIELIGDDEEDQDVGIGSIELQDNIKYATPSCFITSINSEAGRDYRPGSTTLRNDNDLFVGMQFEFKESTLDAIKQFHIHNSFHYIVVESRSDRYITKQLAMSRIYGDYEGSYNELPHWLNVVQNFAPRTIVRYEASRHFVGGIEDPTSFILDRVFWAFKPCIEGFAYCKPILQVDETFFTGKYTGTLLIASSEDGNRRIFPVAFVIVEGETKEA